MRVLLSFWGTMIILALAAFCERHWFAGSGVYVAVVLGIAVGQAIERTGGHA